MFKWMGKYWGKRILHQQKLHQENLHRLMLAIGNGMKTSMADPGQLKSASLYKRCAAFVSLLSPMDIKGGKYVRLGKNHDGGYVMLDYFQDAAIEAAYSFGIDNDVSWEEDVAARNIDVFMYDHTIKDLPKDNSRFHYFKMGVTGFKQAADLKTMGELIEQNQHTGFKNMVLKMDIEGCEWDVFNEVSSDVINKFSQIVLELHDLRPDDDHKKLDVLAKINTTHQSVHVHANSAGVPHWIGNLVLPEVLEVTYVRKADFKDRLVKNTRLFPTDIDQPMAPDMPDVYLGRFAVEE